MQCIAQAGQPLQSGSADSTLRTSVSGYRRSTLAISATYRIASASTAVVAAPLDRQSEAQPSGGYRAKDFDIKLCSYQDANLVCSMHASLGGIEQLTHRIHFVFKLLIRSIHKPEYACQRNGGSEILSCNILLEVTNRFMFSYFNWTKMLLYFKEISF